MKKSQMPDMAAAMRIRRKMRAAQKAGCAVADSFGSLMTAAEQTGRPTMGEDERPPMKSTTTPDRDVGTGDGSARMSQAQKFAAWKANRAAEDKARADAAWAKRVQSGELKGSNQGYGRGWKKWADRVKSSSPNPAYQPRPLE